MNKRHLVLWLLIAAFSVDVSANTVKSTNSDDNIFEKEYIKSLMLRVFNWQVQNPVVGNSTNADDWARAVFYSGIMWAYNSTSQKQYLEEAVRWSERLNYKLGYRHSHADDHTRGQTFLSLYQIMGHERMIMNTRAVYDSLISRPSPGHTEWWWCDALFMSPPVLAKLGKVTGDERYFNYLNSMWWDTTDFLFDKNENLYYRDKNYFNKVTVNGKKVFWSRGNGWVMGGLVQVLKDLPPNNPYYKQYTDLYLKIAAKIVSLQQTDGFWRASLLDSLAITNKETSGSAFYVFALAWGINNHLLDSERYLPAVKKGWEALVSSVTPAGKLTWVQKIGSQPDAVSEQDNQEYGSGALLMAGSEIMKLKVK